MRRVGSDACATIVAVFLFTAMALAQQPKADPATGSIEGTVFDAVTGAPIRKAEVRLGGGFVQSGAPPADLRADTDGAGHFAFRGLTAGSYWMNTQHPGYGPPVRGGASQLTLQPGEQKTGIEIRLRPQASLSGHVSDEFGDPVRGCNVSVLQTQRSGGRRSLQGRNSVNTNDRGDYWVQGLEKGRYYVYARCFGEIEAPHPLMPVKDPRKPFMVYAPEFYPSSPDVKGATLVAMTPGVETRGIDFQVHRVPGVTVRGHIDAVDPSLLAGGNVQVQLLPPSLDPAEGAVFGAGMNRNTGDFELHAVIPGSYVLVASSFGRGPVSQTQIPIQVGTTPPDPIHLVLAPAPSMNGAIEVEGDNPTPPKSLQITLQPLGAMFFGQQPQAKVADDGTFTLAGVTPGKWRLYISGATFVKSVTIGERNVSPYAFDLTQGETGPIRIIASNKTGQVRVSASAAGSAALSFLLVPADPDRADTGTMRTVVSGNAAGPTTISGVIPGRYRLYAFTAADTWNQGPDVLKVLEGHSQLVDVGEGDTVQASAEPIDTDEVDDAIKEAQQAQ